MWAIKILNGSQAGKIFQLNEGSPIATYARRVELKGTKDENEVLAARVKNELFIHENQSID